FRVNCRLSLRESDDVLRSERRHSVTTTIHHRSPDMSTERTTTGATSDATKEPQMQPARKFGLFKTILLVLAVIVIAFLSVVAAQPAEYRITRSATIAAPPAEVFPQVNNLHNWEAWSPWAKLDPAAKNTFEGPPEGTGSIFKWSGNDQIGEG